MAKAKVYDWNKKEVGSVTLEPGVFEQPLRKDILQENVRWQLASRRSGTHSSKTRSQVSGTGAKPFRQKGTGNARQGSLRGPHMEGGAVAFGPHPRKYGYALPKKMRKKGLGIALSYLHREGRLFIVKDMKSEGKTGELQKRLDKFGVKKSVLVDQSIDELFSRASRNLSNFRYLSVDGINVYDLLKFDAAILTQAAVEGVSRRVGGAQ